MNNKGFKLTFYRARKRWLKEDPTGSGFLFTYNGVQFEVTHKETKFGEDIFDIYSDIYGKVAQLYDKEWYFLPPGFISYHTEEFPGSLIYDTEPEVLL